MSKPDSLEGMAAGQAESPAKYKSAPYKTYSAIMKGMRLWKKRKWSASDRP